MRKFLVTIVSAGMLAGVIAIPGPASAMENCHVVRATADARNPQVSTERAQHRLQHYIARHLSSLGGKTISAVSTHCIRNACEASAIVCLH
jgi:hypothetical protein